MMKINAIFVEELPAGVLVFGDVFTLQLAR